MPSSPGGSKVTYVVKIRAGVVGGQELGWRQGMRQQWLDKIGSRIKYMWNLANVVNVCASQIMPNINLDP